MTPIECAIDIASFIGGEFLEFVPTDKKISKNKIVIRSGFMPAPKNNDEKAKLCPYVVVRPAEIDDSDDAEEESKVELLILMATYNEDTMNGHMEIYHMLEIVRQALLKKRVIADRYELKLPLKTTIPEIQPFPLWMGYITASYLIPPVQEELILSE